MVATTAHLNMRFDYTHPTANRARPPLTIKFTGRFASGPDCDASFQAAFDAVTYPRKACQECRESVSVPLEGLRNSQA